MLNQLKINTKYRGVYFDEDSRFYADKVKQ